MNKRRSLDYDGLDGVLDVAATGQSATAWRPGYGLVAVVLIGSVGAFLSLSSMQQSTAPVTNQQSVADSMTPAKPAESISPPVPMAVSPQTETPTPGENKPVVEAAVDTAQPSSPPVSSAVSQMTGPTAIYFKLDASRPNLSDQNQLKTVLEAAQHCPDLIQLTGHTCNLGTPDLNKALGLTRAANVKKWLVTQGITAEKIRIASEGMDKPAASNQTPQGQALNRRVELICVTP